MTDVIGYDTYEPLTNKRDRYVYMPDGSTISRRQFDKLPKTSNGAFTERIIEFSNSGTRHRILTIPKDNLSSIWRLATDNSSSRLPSNTSVAFRGQGRLVFSSGEGTASTRQTLQTSFWGTRSAALNEWHRLINELRQSEIYGFAVEIEFDNFQVVFRSG